MQFTRTQRNLLCIDCSNALVQWPQVMLNNKDSKEGVLRYCDSDRFARNNSEKLQCAAAQACA